MVALSEGVHCATEPLEFRNRLLQYLVLHKGFTAIAIESGIVESRLVYNYVRGGPGDLQGAVTQGISWGFDVAPQNWSLVRWLREYNADPAHERKINFYGFDVPGSPSSTRSNFGCDTALGEALNFLSHVDLPASRVFHARLDPFVTIQFHFRHPVGARSYAGLAEVERNALTAAIADLVTWLERHEAKYTSVSTAEEYAWACRAAVSARQMDSWLRQVPIGWVPSDSPSDDKPQFFSVISDLRDRAQVDNLEWIVRQEGPSGKVLVFASRYHLSAAPLKASWHPHRQEDEQQVAGTYLRRRFSQDLVTIGNLVGQGRVAYEVLGEAPEQSLDGLAREVGTPLFLLDLRSAPEQVRDWLNQEHQLIVGSQMLKLPVSQAFDILFYIDTVTPANLSAT